MNSIVKFVSTYRNRIIEVGLGIAAIAGICLVGSAGVRESNELAIAEPCEFADEEETNTEPDDVEQAD